MKNAVLIKLVSPVGREPKLFRAYSLAKSVRDRGSSLGVTCSCTGNEDWGIRKCAVKAFIKQAEPTADPDEIETRIGIKPQSAGLWLAVLQAKGGE